MSLSAFSSSALGALSSSALGALRAPGGAARTTFPCPRRAAAAALCPGPQGRVGRGPEVPACLLATQT